MMKNSKLELLKYHGELIKSLSNPREKKNALISFTHAINYFKHDDIESISEYNFNNIINNFLISVSECKGEDFIRFDENGFAKIIALSNGSTGLNADKIIGKYISELNKWDTDYSYFRAFFKDVNLIRYSNEVQKYFIDLINQNYNSDKEIGEGALIIIDIIKRGVKLTKNKSKLFRPVYDYITSTNEIDVVLNFIHNTLVNLNDIDFKILFNSSNEETRVKIIETVNKSKSAYNVEFLEGITKFLSNYLREYFHEENISNIIDLIEFNFFANNGKVEELPGILENLADLIKLIATKCEEEEFNWDSFDLKNKILNCLTNTLKIKEIKDEDRDKCVISIFGLINVKNKLDFSYSIVESLKEGNFVVNDIGLVNEKTNNCVQTIFTYSDFLLNLSNDHVESLSTIADWLINISDHESVSKSYMGMESNLIWNSVNYIHLPAYFTGYLIPTILFEYEEYLIDEHDRFNLYFNLLEIEHENAVYTATCGLAKNKEKGWVYSEEIHERLKYIYSSTDYGLETKDVAFVLNILNNNLLFKKDEIQYLYIHRDSIIKLEGEYFYSTDYNIIVSKLIKVLSDTSVVYNSEYQTSFLLIRYFIKHFNFDKKDLYKEIIVALNKLFERKHWPQILDLTEFAAMVTKKADFPTFLEYDLSKILRSMLGWYKHKGIKTHIKHLKTELGLNIGKKFFN